MTVGAGQSGNFVTGLEKKRWELRIEQKYSCGIQMQRLGAKVWTTDGRGRLRSPALSRVNCLALTHTHTRLLPHL